MIAFITSLRHPLNSDSYDRVEALLERTLVSVTAQSDKELVVIVVGNKRPDFELPPRVHFVGCDFPPPSSLAQAQTELKPFVWDKGTKIGIGLAAARQFNPDFVMIFDADDFVSRRLAGFANSHPTSPGWVVKDGWMYSARRQAFRPITDFNRTCGTCFVLPFDAYDVPETLEVTADQAEVAEAFGERLWRILGAHRDAVEWHREHGRELEILPFRGAVYHVDTGENHSGKSMGGFARPSTRKLRAEFGMSMPTNFLMSLWRSVNVGGPRVVLAGLRRRAQLVVGTRSGPDG